MPTVPLYLGDAQSKDVAGPVNSLPNLLQTPSGLAILEIQGTIHAPFPERSEDHDTPSEVIQTSVGRIEFPLYNPQADAADTKWMKRVYLYVGKHQRLTGEVKKLPKALAVVAKRAQIEGKNNDDMVLGRQHASPEDLEILEVVKYKILFGGRPEPVAE